MCCGAASRFCSAIDRFSLSQQPGRSRPQSHPRTLVSRSMVRFGRVGLGQRGPFVGAACAIFLWAPWRGPIVLSLSTAHGIDAGDLQGWHCSRSRLIAARGLAPGSAAESAGPVRRWVGPASAVVLGGLLLAGLLLDPTPRL